MTAFIFGFTNSWNEFLLAVVMEQRNELRTIPAGLYSFQVSDVLLWGQLMVMKCSPGGVEGETLHEIPQSYRG